MKNHRLGSYVALACAGALFIQPAVAQDKAAGEGKSKEASMQEMMKKAEEAGRPGADHKALDAFVGEWTTEAKCYMDPSSPPMINRGTASVRSVLGGRYVQEEFNGEFMGKPFKGIGLTGYDNLKKKYTSVWVDDMSTQIFATEGTADSGHHVYTFEGKMDDATTGEKDKPMKLIIRMISPKQHVFEMHDVSKGAQSKVMEITYTKK
jgi:hypothetical protein